MKLRKTDIPDVCIIEYEPRSDDRGSFVRIFCEQELAAGGISFPIVQANLSLNTKKGTLRGLHFQRSPKAEDKIVQCLKGKIYDVVLDLRPNTGTYGKWLSYELSESALRSIYIPKGCAHGFQTLTDYCEVLYCMSEFYSPEHYSGIRWDDPRFGITWPIANPVLSRQDQSWPLV